MLYHEHAYISGSVVVNQIQRERSGGHVVSLRQSTEDGLSSSLDMRNVGKVWECDSLSGANEWSNYYSQVSLP
jgi:hypothetical protein